jgi:rubrerythrin
MVRRFLLRLILEEAIRREEEAYRFYEAAQGPVREPEARELLRRLCAEELRHRLKLQELQARGRLDLELEAQSPEEAELLTDSGPAPAPVLADLKPADVWRLALGKERLAVTHYGLLARRVSLRLPRQVFSFLAAEEQRHVEWVLGALGSRT